MPVRIGGRGGGGGRVTEEVYTPAVALFEHPEDATTLFEAADGGAEGLTITLGEPLEYGQDTSQWSIAGAQRYQGVPDTPSQNPSIVGNAYPTTGGTTGYLGSFTTANRPDYSALTGNASIYDRTLGRFMWSNGIFDWAVAANSGQLTVYGADLLLNFESVTAGLQPRAVEFANQDAAAAYLGANIDRWRTLSTHITGYTDSDEDLLWVDVSDNYTVKTLGTVGPAVPAAAASVDIPTSDTGGVRVTADNTGPDANDWYVRLSAGPFTNVIRNGNQFLLVVTNGTTANEVRTVLNNTSGISAAYYGTETGSTIVYQNNQYQVSGWGHLVDFRLSGGVDAIDYIPPVPGILEDPVHVTIDAENQRITAYYNLAAGGRLTEADTLGDLKGAFDVAAEGLSSAYVGGGDADTVMTRTFTTTDQFSMANLRGLQLALTAPTAAGEAGNSFGLVTRARFPGGAEVSETQAHILIYTTAARNGGVRINLESGIQGLNEHGAPVDISSGVLGNDWTLVVRSGEPGQYGVVRLNTVTKQIIWYGPASSLQDTSAAQLLNACNQGGTGCSAVTFNHYTGSSRIFSGTLARVNTRRDFHGGRNFHAATANPEPITVTQGPAHASTRLYTTSDSGIILSLTEPAYDEGNGFQFETAEGDLAAVLVPTEERITLTIPTAGATSAEIIAALIAVEGLSAVYFGTEDGTTNVLPARFGRHEMLGGLDATEIEIAYAFEATGGISDPDTMGDIKTAWDDAAAGRLSFYYNGADAATVASRHAPWEHEFENGATDTINLSGFGLGPEQNEFTGSDRAAAEAARDAYAVANPTWVEAYRGHANVWIALRWGANQVGQTLRANASNPPGAGDWIDQNLALKGGKGDKGDMGDTSDVKPFARVGGPQVPDSEIPAEVMRDAEFTAAAVRNLIGLTAAQLNDLLTGATLVNRVLSFPQADGSTVTLTLPADMDTQDGVVAGASIDAQGNELTLTLDTGATVVASIPAVLRNSGITVAQAEAAADSRITAGVKDFARTGGRDVQVGDMDSTGATDDQVPTADGSGGVAWEDQQGTTPTPPPTPVDAVFFGWSTSQTITTADLNDTLSRVNSDTTDFENEWPPNDVNAYFFVAVRESDGEPTELYRPPNPVNQINFYSRQAGTVDDGNGDAHIVIVSNNQFAVSTNARPVRVGFA